MLPNSFDFYQAENLSEAFNLYHTLQNPVFYSGGSEIITMMRMSSIAPNNIIDLKLIPECQELKLTQDKLIIGACVSLTRIKESMLFPLLSTTVGRISDHTNQTRITIGGNVCGNIIYKESVLPLLLTDATVVIMTHSGEKTLNIGQIFNERIELNPGEFIIRFEIDKKYLNCNYFHIKKTKNEKIDYPLLTIAGLYFETKIRIAFSGLLNYPFRSINIENILNNPELSIDDKINNSLAEIPDKIINNIDGSEKYRMFVFKNTLRKVLENNDKI